MIYCVDAKALKRFERFHYVVAELFAGSTVISACDGKLLFFEAADVKRFCKLVCLFLKTDVGKEHYAAAEHGAGVCIFCSAFFNHSGCGAVDSFKHSVLFADVCTADIGEGYA